ncbi:hypothetical protein [Rubinisphaera italica]|uniref:Uncharacterized protein n=1 Tax=Rubinisphaera italica TaxID=2527969 RepID=A0A5C5XIB5_9PLAN|nr:hypothetical protein [Rubinisphaera italica]TWT62877.1 hypothetical protein Pan54_36230 [Rubinisphaera italica]
MDNKQEQLQKLKNQFIFGQNTRYQRICVESNASSVEEKITVAQKVISQWCSGTTFELFHEQILLNKLL